MTIQNTSPWNQYTANGSQTVFTYNFEIFDQDDIQVLDGQTLKTITTDYTVTGVGSNTGGTVVFTSAPANGANITLYRSTTRVRTVDYQSSGPINADILSGELDRFMAIAQEHDAVDQLSIKIPTTDTTGITTTLPVAALRANKAIVCDASGNVSVSADNYNDQLANVTAQAVAAAASALAASNSQTAASNSASAAAGSAASAASSLTALNDKFLGNKTSDPTLDNSGNALAAGATYFNTTSNALKYYTGSAWLTLTAVATEANLPNTIVLRDGSGNFSAGVITGTATAARYSDLAEYYSAASTLEAGTVVKIATGTAYDVEATSSAYDTEVLGVVSTQPGFMMNYAPERGGVPIALAGRVPVKVIGQVRKGQQIVTSPIEGVAQALTAAMIEHRPALLGAVIGRALENKTGSDVGLVECVVIAQR